MEEKLQEATTKTAKRMRTMWAGSKAELGEMGPTPLLPTFFSNLATFFSATRFDTVCTKNPNFIQQIFVTLI